MPRNIFLALFASLLFTGTSNAQQWAVLTGSITDEKGIVSDALVHLKNSGLTTTADSLGRFTFAKVPVGKETILIRYIGYDELVQTIEVKAPSAPLQFQLKSSDKSLQEVVVTGNLREMKKSESPVPVEIYTAKFFLKNPTPPMCSRP